MNANAVLCPHCSGVLYETAPIEGSPFNSLVKESPKIKTESNTAFMLCSHCTKRVIMIAAGNGFRVSPIQKKD